MGMERQVYLSWPNNAIRAEICRYAPITLLSAATLFDRPLAKFDGQTWGREKRPRKAS